MPERQGMQQIGFGAAAIGTRPLPGSYGVGLSVVFLSSRRIASRLILVSVLPVLTASPIWNCHFQTLGTAVTATVYCTPLCIMRNLRHDSLRTTLSITSSCICSILLSMCETAVWIQGKWTARAHDRPACARNAESSVPSAEHYVVQLSLVGS